MHKARALRSAAFTRALLFVLVPVLTLLLPVAARAQGASSVSGTVTDSARLPLPQARVGIIGSDQVAITGADGTFSLPVVALGNQLIEVKLLGYAPSRTSVEIHPGETLHLVVMLAPQPIVMLAAQPVELSPVEVRTRRQLSSGLRGFDERKGRGGAHFFDHAQIEKMQPRQVTDVLRRVPGLQINPSAGPYGQSFQIRSSRNTGVMGIRACPVLFYVNGTPFPVTGDISINHFVPAEDLVGVEVYPGTSSIPPQFNSVMHNAQCGVIVLWTRTGNQPRQQRARAAPSQ